MDQFDQLHNLESNSRWKEAIRSYDVGDVEVALKLFFEVDLCPKSAYNVGILEMKLEQFEEAKAAFTQALQLDPNFTVAYLQLAICHYILGEIQEARRHFQGAIESGRGLKEIDYVHVLLDYDLLKEKVEYNLSLCNRAIIPENEVPFGAPHRLYLPPRNIGSITKTTPVFKDPAVGKPEAVRPRARSDMTTTRVKDLREPRKNRANSLGEMWERLFHSKKKRNKDKKMEKPVDTLYSPICAKKYKINRCFSNSEGELPSNKNPLRRRSIDLVKIDFEEIQMAEEIGRGSFGAVYMARWRGADCCCKIPAKTQKETTRLLFIQEIENMRKLIHPNICQFLGVVEEPLCLVIELMREGSVINLMNNRTVTMDAAVVTSIAKQTSCGMLYLHSKGILHGDLAARNLLYRTELTADGSVKYIIKITDFGLSVLTDKETCDVSDRTTFPIRWSAPEVLKHQEMSKASDAWSFGVLLWELLQRAQPYSEMNADEVVERVCKGYRLPRPSRIPYPMELNQLMDTCWFPDPHIRPDFSQIEIMLEIIENSVCVSSPPRPSRPSQCQGCSNRIEIGDRFCRFCGFQM